MNLRALRGNLALLCLFAPWAGVCRGDEDLKEPQPHRVYQRDRSDRATIPIILADNDQGISVARADLGPAGKARGAIEGVKFTAGALVGVPTGGPYKIEITLRKGDSTVGSVHVGPVFVGDLWVLAGQSNMQGVGDLIDVTPSDNRVMLLGMDGQWTRAEEPLHWLVDSPDTVHSGDPATREERSKKEHQTRKKGAGLGLPFAVEMVKATNVPVGLIACAHGGTSMAQWSPDKKGEGGKSLYGSMLRQVERAGGKVKGVLWYQGESDANPSAAEIYPRVCAELIAAVRRDFEQPDLPFYFVQIGRFVSAGDPKPWNAVQEAQRLIPERVPNTAVVAVIDLELDDGIHVGTQGLKRAGGRLAQVALHEMCGRPGGQTPTLDKVLKGAGNTLVLKMKGVNSAGSVGLKPERHIAGFSIRKDDGSEIPLIFEAAVGPSKDAVVLKLNNKIPAGAKLWYGWGFDPFCNLTDGTDMAVPVFGPIDLNGVE